ncbi:MAG: S-formylglutathione hydrolase [Sarcina sp.]
MELKQLEKHKSFNGEQYKYSHYSEILKCDMTFSIYLPENKGNKEIPLIWWLSGLTCSDDNFTQKSGFQRLASKHNVAVIMPDTSPRGEHVADDEMWDLGQGAGFYLDATQKPWSDNFKMYTYITEELSKIAKDLVPNFSGKESIMGHSMGGHGALVIGMKNADRFKAISAFAPIMNPMNEPWGIKVFKAYLGEDKNTWKSWDASELVKNSNMPEILITQGTEDGFYEEHLQEKTFLDNAKEAKNNVEYKKVEGFDHSYFFISTFIEEHFDFHMKNLK